MAANICGYLYIYVQTATDITVVFLTGPAAGFMKLSFIVTWSS